MVGLKKGQSFVILFQNNEREILHIQHIQHILLYLLSLKGPFVRPRRS